MTLMHPRGTLTPDLGSPLTSTDALVALERLHAEGRVTTDELVDQFWVDPAGGLHSDPGCSARLVDREQLDVRDGLSADRFGRCECRGWPSSRQGRWAHLAHLAYLVLAYPPDSAPADDWAGVHLLCTLTSKGLLGRLDDSAPPGVCELAELAEDHARGLAVSSAEALDATPLVEAIVAQGVRVGILPEDGPILKAAAVSYRIQHGRNRRRQFPPLDQAVVQALSGPAEPVLVLLSASGPAIEALNRSRVPELELLTLIQGRRFGNVVALVVTGPIADGLQALLTNLGHGRLTLTTALLPCSGIDRDALIETAAGLWDPSGDGPLSDAAGCLKAAAGL
jgi:hypothetical protein